jgi:hypothetical protein
MRNVSRMAIATGISTVCSHYKPATTSAMIAQPLFISVVPRADLMSDAESRPNRRREAS